MQVMNGVYGVIFQQRHRPEFNAPSRQRQKPVVTYASEVLISVCIDSSIRIASYTCTLTVVFNAVPNG
jgi:hypothetical protein